MVKGRAGGLRHLSCSLVLGTRKCTPDESARMNTQDRLEPRAAGGVGRVRRLGGGDVAAQDAAPKKCHVLQASDSALLFKDLLKNPGVFGIGFLSESLYPQFRKYPQVGQQQPLFSPSECKPWTKKWSKSIWLVPLRKSKQPFSPRV